MHACLLTRTLCIGASPKKKRVRGSAGADMRGLGGAPLTTTVTETTAQGARGAWTTTNQDTYTTHPVSAPYKHDLQYNEVLATRVFWT